ncbi:MAG: thiamine-phosphate kinase [Ignavibacteriae bacterium]|nr:thiamine-phosphate kinase [Ignavibacteriota bacterium]
MNTPISSLGEVALIEHLRTIVEGQFEDSSLRQQLLKGISDDTAVYQPTEGNVQLITTDAFVEGVHFDLTYTSFKHLGWKLMAANLSDIAAMGGIPRYAVISLALPSKISVEMVEELYRGIAFACKEYSCILVGGDTVASVANMFLSVTLIGEAEKEKVAYRHGAKVGDVLCVTGTLGAAHAGLKILQREKERFISAGNAESFQPNLALYTEVLERHLMPKPRLDISRILMEHVQVHSMIDISDGLASEVHRICKESKVGGKVYEHKIPLLEKTKSITDEFSERGIDYALFGGEDYELLFSISEDELEKLQSLTNDISVVGKIVSQHEGIELVKENGESVMLPFGGFEHFR